MHERIFGTGYISLLEYRRTQMSEQQEMAIRQRAAKILVKYRRRLARVGVTFPHRMAGESPMADYRRLRLAAKALNQIESIIPEGFREVTKAEFFAAIGPKDVGPTCGWPDHTEWVDSSRNVIGWSYPGWRNGGLPEVPKVWALKR